MIGNDFIYIGAKANMKRILLSLILVISLASVFNCSENKALAADFTISYAQSTGAVTDFATLHTHGIAPFGVQFHDQSTGGITDWAWDLDGDGVIDSKVKDAFFVYNIPGIYTVTLTVTGDGNSDTITMTDYIIVSDTRISAYFSATPLSGTCPLNVSFSNLSTSYDGINSWLWDFGDGETSKEQSPNHEYTQEGVYTVSLTVTEDDGDFDTEVKENYIEVSS